MKIKAKKINVILLILVFLLSSILVYKFWSNYINSAEYLAKKLSNLEIPDNSELIYFKNSIRSFPAEEKIIIIFKIAKSDRQEFESQCIEHNYKHVADTIILNGFDPKGRNDTLTDSYVRYNTAWDHSYYDRVNGYLFVHYNSP